jgi:hypothetical protein
VNEDKDWVEVEVNAPADSPKADVTPVEEPKEKPEKDEDSDLGHRAQKRIRKLLAERKESEAQVHRMREELEAAKKAADEARVKAKETESTAYDLYGKSALDKVKLAEKRFQDAYDAADKESLLQAQHELIEAKLEVKALEAWQRSQKAEPPPAPQQQPAQQAPQLAPATKSWMDKNAWFGRGPDADRIATGTAVAISDELIEEGFDPASEEFYQEVEKRLVAELPRMANRLGGIREPEPRKPVVAGQSRTPGRRIRLDEGTVKASARLGASLEDTARYAEKIQDAGDGYVNIDVKRGRK